MDHGFFLKYYFYLFEKQRSFPLQHTHRKSSVYWFIPQMPITTRVGQAETRDLKFNLSLPCGWQRLKYLSHHLLPFRMQAGSWNQKKSQDANLSPLFQDMGSPSGTLTAVPNTALQFIDDKGNPSARGNLLHH